MYTLICSYLITQALTIINMCLTFLAGDSLLTAWNPVCIGIVHGVIGKIKLHPGMLFSFFQSCSLYSTCVLFCLLLTLILYRQHPPAIKRPKLFLLAHTRNLAQLPHSLAFYNLTTLSFIFFTARKSLDVVFNSTLSMHQFNYNPFC